MKVKSFAWYDEGIAGGIIVECDCGEIMEYDTIDTEDEKNIICDKCKKIFTLKSSIMFEWIEHT